MLDDEGMQLEDERGAEPQPNAHRHRRALHSLLLLLRHSRGAHGGRPRAAGGQNADVI